ncbi:MAG: hypothetical protein R6U32_07630 [Candidatus Woesearchaeota archaeon]
MSGIFGVVSQKECRNDLFWGTHYVQHRAQEYCGLATYDGREFNPQSERGILKNNFPRKKREGIEGYSGVGAVASERQPVSELSRSGGMVTCFDGNIINNEEIKNGLLKGGATFSGYHNPEAVNDSVLVSRIISEEVNFEKGIESLVNEIKGDFAVISLTKEGIYAARGWGRKPLIIGEKDGSYAVSSESNSFENPGFEIYRDVEPGEIVLLNKDGVHHVKQLDMNPIKYGTFEWIYTAYPSSVIDGRSVALVREEIGRLLAERCHVEADIISPIPNSGRWHAMGYSNYYPLAKGLSDVSGVKYAEVFVRYDYSSRSFTPGDQDERDEEAWSKLIPVRAVIKGNRIIIVDDSIVRGTQTLNKTHELRHHGAKEVHCMVACPPLTCACSYGKTTKKDEDCLARRMPVEEFPEKLGLDSINFATVDELEKAIGISKKNLCLECWQ